MSLLKIVWRELLHRKSQLISGLLAITLGIGVIVGIQSVTRVSEIAVAIRRRQPVPQAHAAHGDR